MQTINTIAFSLLLSTPIAYAADALLLKTAINGVEKGILPAMYDDGHYWLELDALHKSGLSTAQGETREFDGVRFIRIDRIDHIQGQVNEAELQLNLTARAQDLGHHTVDLYQGHAQQLPNLTGLSGYLDYTTSAFQLANQEMGYGFAPTLNLSNGAWNFRSSFDYQSSGREDKWLRLGSTLTYDMPQSMARLTLGDMTSSGGDLGRTRSMAGVGFARAFGLQPDFSPTPSFETTTPITNASTAEVYLNGQRINTVDLAPGMYNFADLRYFSGMQDVTLVIRDAFGRTQTLSVPFYYDDSLLKAGLQEFSYNVGVARSDHSFNDYAGLAYSAFHRIGLTDWLTTGFEASGSDGDKAGSLFSTIRLGKFGILGGAYGLSRHADGSQGHGSVLHYNYQNQDFATFVSAQRQSRNYWLNHEQLVNGSLQPDWGSNIGISFGQSSTGNWSIDLGRQVGASHDTTFTRYRIGYSIAPWKQMTVSSNVTLRDYGDERRWSAFINLSWYLGKDFNLYTSSQHDSTGNYNTVSVANTPPTGSGWAYNLSAQQGKNSNDYSGWLQRRTDYGNADISYYRSENDGNNNQSWRMSLAGSLAFGHSHYGLTRPNGQSFAIVDTSGVADIGVYQNGEEVARSNQDGIAFVPSLSSYSYQQLSLKQDDLPLDITAEGLSREILTGNNNGQSVRFALWRVSALAALLVRADGKPVHNQIVTLHGQNQTLTGATTLNGNLYVEGVSAGRYTLMTGECQLEIEIPEKHDAVYDAGQLTCTATPSHGAATR